MSWFKRKVKVSSPTLVPAAAANVPYKNTGIIVQPGLMPLPGGGNSTQTLYRALEEIEVFPSGANLMAALQQAGTQIGVRYGGPNNNSAAGGVKGYTKLRKAHQADDNASFAAELQTTITAMTQATGRDINALADELYRKKLPRWSGGQDESPFRLSAPPLVVAHQPVPLPGAPGAAPRYAAPNRPPPATPVAMIVQKLQTFLAGTVLPTKDEMDVLTLCLLPHLRPGDGCATRVFWDPHKTIVAGKYRPPHVALYHELVHAYYNAIGKQYGREDSVNEDNGGRLFELQCVGMPPFENEQLSENRHRADWGVELRGSYP